MYLFRSAKCLLLVMKYRLLKGLLLLCLLGGISSGFAQKKGKSPVASTNTSIDGRMEMPSGKPVKKIRVLYKNDLKGTLPGNRCVEELSHKMGFRYEQVMKNGPGSMSQEGIFFHNLGTKIVLFFKNGPFWQARFKKKRKECQQKTGDYMG